METLLKVVLLLVLCSLISCQPAARNLPRIPVKLTRTQLMNIESQVIKQAMVDEKSTEPPEVECGVPNGKSDPDDSQLIKATEENEFPWQVALLVHVDQSYFFCGGSLINSFWVLTSAHCVEGASSIYIYLGAHNLTAVTEPHRQIYVTDVYYIHPDWNYDDLAGDIGLVQFVLPVTFTEHIKPICLPESSDNDQPGDDVILTGWGRQFSGKQNFSSVLRTSKSAVISNDRCSKIYKDIVTNEILCTNSSVVGSTCNADSGSPLYFVDADGIYTQIGIASFGSTHGCKKAHPSGFTRVESYLDWIDFVLNALQDPNATEEPQSNTPPSANERKEPHSDTRRVYDDLEDISNTEPEEESNLNEDRKELLDSEEDDSTKELPDKGEDQNRSIDMKDSPNASSDADSNQKIGVETYLRSTLSPVVESKKNQHVTAKSHNGHSRNPVASSSEKQQIPVETHTHKPHEHLKENHPAVKEKKNSAHAHHEKSSASQSKPAARSSATQIFFHNSALGIVVVCYFTVMIRVFV